MLKSKNRGFTLIELLVVIAILSVLLVIVLVAINPARQTRSARNTQRRADVLVLLNAVNQYFVETGNFPDGTPAEGAAPKNISSTAMSGSTFCSDLVPDYVAAFPVDPFDSTGSHSYSFSGTSTCPGSWDTGYTIQRLTGDRITVAAPESLNDGLSATVSATR